MENEKKEPKKKHVTQQTSIFTADDLEEIKKADVEKKKEKRGFFSFFRRKKDK